MSKTTFYFLVAMLTMRSLPVVAQEPFRVSRHLVGEMIQNGQTIKISVNLPRSSPVQTTPQYACPMHPKVTSSTPGKCPICEMPLVLRGPDNEARATFTSLSQAVMDYPFDSFTVKDGNVHFVLGGSTVFDGTATSHRIDGHFRGPDGVGDFHLEPAPPEHLPYSIREVKFHHGPITLAGSLLIPRTSGKHAGVVLLHGSGPQTRRGTPRFIADRFARAGIAALIYDKRGSGSSTGSLDSFIYADLAGDAVAAVRLLALQPEVDPHKVGLLGHSEGGITAVVAAALAPREIAFLVAEDTVAGPVYQSDLYRVNRAIQQTGFHPEEIRQAMGVYSVFVDVARGLKSYSELEEDQGRYGNTEWFQWLAIPPRDAALWPTLPQRENLDTLIFWRQVNVPVLLVYGEKDELAPVDRSIEAIGDAVNGRVAFTAVVAPGAQHNLTIHPQPGEPFFWWKAAPGIVDLAVSWVHAQPGH